MFKLRAGFSAIFILMALCLASSCGERISFTKTQHIHSISYQDLEAYYLENYPKVQEPIKPEDKEIYTDYKDILYLSEQVAIQASLNAIEAKLEAGPSANYQNIVSLYLLLGQFHEYLLNDQEKALAIYQKIWQEIQSIQFLHPYFDPKQKQMTKEWYILFSDAEALMKAGDIYKRTERPKLALKCYKRVLRYYDNKLTGPYSYDFPDRYGRVVTAKIVELEPVKMPEVEPVRSYSGDRRAEFAKMAATFPGELVKGDIKKWIGYISYGGVIIGYAPVEQKWTDHKVVVYQLQHKMGPQYDMLFGWIKSLKAQPDEIQVNADRENNQYRAVLIHPQMNAALHLNFRPIDSIWYLTGLYLY